MLKNTDDMQEPTPAQIQTTVSDTELEIAPIVIEEAGEDVSEWEKKLAKLEKK